ncbi:MAG: energy transducer TonB [Candidatus Acidiferrales bacterium]
MRLSAMPKSLTERAPELHACNLGVAWESPWRELGSSLRDFFTGPRPAKGGTNPGNPSLRVQWVCGRLPMRAFLAACLWHVAIVMILILPIWGFLPQAENTLAPVQIEVTYVPAQDLPLIFLAAPTSKPNAPAKKARAPETSSEQRGADAYHPRQTILSVPVRVTHPRQTLIQPDAPPTAPNIDAHLPNMVQWAPAETPKARLQLSPIKAAPRTRQLMVNDVAVPEVPNSEKNPGPLDIGVAPVENPQVQMPMSATSAVAVQRKRQTDSAAAPDIGSTASSTDANLHRLIALSATPAPPVPEVSVPHENLAARVAISPERHKPERPGALERGSTGAESSSGVSPAGMNGMKNAAGDADSLPAAVSIRGGSSSSGAVATSARSKGRLNLTPMPSASSNTRRGPSVVGAIDPNVPPEKILSGKEVYTLDINLPNLTSATGSWILNFAQLYEDDTPSYRRGKLSRPAPIQKVDPKYPPELIKEHVEGEVVLYAIIRKDGSVHNIQVVKGLDPQLDKNAVDALSQWKFRPAVRDGVPVDLEAVAYIPFRYRSPQ